MEAKTSLVGAQGAGHLDAKAAVDLNFPLVVYPRDSEGDDAVRLDQALQNLVLLILRMLFQERDNRGQHLTDGVFKMALIGIALRYQIQNIIHVLFHVRHNNSSLLSFLEIIQ